MPDTNIRQHIGQQILTITTGHSSEDAMCAQADALATSVGGICFLSAMSLAEAQEMLAKLQRGMMQHLVDNWGSIERGDH